MVDHKEHVVGNDVIEIEEANLDFPINTLEHTKELEELEMEVVATPLSPLELAIAEEKLNNISMKAISKRLGVSEKIVRIVLSRRHVKAYIKDIFEEVTAASKDERIQLMASIIANKLEEEGITSKLDLATLLQLQDSMGKVKEQADTGSQNNVMINILNSIRKD